MEGVANIFGTKNNSSSTEQVNPYFPFNSGQFVLSAVIRVNLFPAFFKALIRMTHNLSAPPQGFSEEWMTPILVFVPSGNKSIYTLIYISAINTRRRDEHNPSTR